MGGWRQVLAGLGAVLLLGACSTGSSVVDRREEAPLSESGGQSGLWPQPANPLTGEAPSSGWADAVPAELAPTGLEVVVRPGAQALVVDGSGAAWLHGPWHLVRVDPRTGAAETWDVGDDPVFGDVIGVRGSARSGAWLLLRDRIRLFDGDRFVRDIPVPTEFLGGPDGAVADLVEVGTEVWIASRAGVARWTGGGWGLVRAAQLTGVRALAVDSEGAVWAAGQFRAGDRRRSAVVRLERAGWAEPTAEGAPRLATQLVAHPEAGVVALYGSDVRWFDGTSWQAFPLAGMGLGIGAVRTRVLAMTEDGTAWLLGDEGVARGTPGGWTPLPTAAESALVGVASVGEDLLVADGSSLHRVDGDALTEVWSERPQGPVASQAGVEDTTWWGDPLWSAGRQLAVQPEGLGVVSADEIWVRSELYPFPLRYSAGTWQEVPVVMLQGPPLVVATDGAVWLGTSNGLVRISGTTRTRIGSVPVGDQIQPALDGSVVVPPPRWGGWWYADGYVDGPPDYLRIRRVAADGVVSEIPMPVDQWSLTTVMGGPEGLVWATACAWGGIDPCLTPSELLRWDGGDGDDGGWAPVPYPGSDVTLVGVAADGALWARITQRSESAEAEGAVEADDGPAVLARHVDGRWTTVLDRGVPRELVMAPGDSVCGMDATGGDVMCVDASGRVTTWPVGVPGELRIGLDGSAWLAGGARPWGHVDGAGGGMVARLPFNVRG